MDNEIPASNFDSERITQFIRVLPTLQNRDDSYSRFIQELVEFLNSQDLIYPNKGEKVVLDTDTGQYYDLNAGIYVAIQIAKVVDVLITPYLDYDPLIKTPEVFDFTQIRKSDWQQAKNRITAVCNGDKKQIKGTFDRTFSEFITADLSRNESGSVWKDIDQETRDSIEKFTRFKATKKPEIAKQYLTALESYREKYSSFNPLENLSKTKKVLEHKYELPVSDISYETFKKWIRKYLQAD